MWRGGLGVGLHPCQGFPVRGYVTVCRAPFPRPAHRTGHADLPHPAFGQSIILSQTEGSCDRTRCQRLRRHRYGIKGKGSEKPKHPQGKPARFLFTTQRYSPGLTTLLNHRDTTLRHRVFRDGGALQSNRVRLKRIKKSQHRLSHRAGILNSKTSRGGLKLRQNYFEPTSSAFFLAAMISSWMLDGTRR